MRLLFICAMNRFRSRTAENLFSERCETDSAGIYERPVTAEQLRRADVVFVMEEYMRSTIAEWYPRLYMQKRIIALGTPDVYIYEDPELVSRLEDAVGWYLEDAS